MVQREDEEDVLVNKKKYYISTLLNVTAIILAVTLGREWNKLKVISTKEEKKKRKTSFRKAIVRR